MANSEAAYDVFITYEQRDAAFAREVAEKLHAFGLKVFDAHSIEPGADIEDSILNAMRESDAVVAIVPTEVESSQMLLELGAAFALKLSVYAVVPRDEIATVPSVFRRSIVLPIGRVNEIAEAISRKLDPLTEADREALSDIYRDEETPVDQLFLRPHRLDEIVDRLGEVTGRTFSNVDVLRTLLNMRKRGSLPTLQRKPQKK